MLENILRLQATESPNPGTVTTPEIINTFHKADMDSLPMFCVGGASLLVLSVSYERANVANIVLYVQPGRLVRAKCGIILY